MSNAVAKAAATALAASQSFLAAAKQAQANTPKVGMSPFLKMGKDGIWTYGPENLEVQEGSIWAIDPDSYRIGYSCWTDWEKLDLKKKNDRMGEITVGLGKAPVDPDKLQKFTHEYGDGQSITWEWNPMISVELVCTNGEDKGVRVVYSTSSHGGMGVLSGYMDKMIASCEESIAAGEPMRSVALVTLGFSTYEHKRFGKTYNPVFEYEEWRDKDDGEAPAEPEIETPAEQETEDEAIEKAEKKKPAAKPRRRPAAQPDTQKVDEAATTSEGDAPAPTRRRRPAA